LLSLVFVTLALAPTPGRWECQSMGADTDAKVSVRGDEVVIYRAQYPEFEGKPYKLEHLFRLKLSGTKLSPHRCAREGEARPGLLRAGRQEHGHRAGSLRAPFQHLAHEGRPGRAR
jgi:hypothetical protein